MAAVVTVPPSAHVIRASLKEMQTSLQCPICLEMLSNPYNTHCGHSYCKECIHTAIASCKKPKCPMCKEPITKRSLRENEKMAEVVKTVQELEDAIIKDTGITSTPPKVFPHNSEVTSGTAGLAQHSKLHPSPLKPRPQNNGDGDGGSSSGGDNCENAQNQPSTTRSSSRKKRKFSNDLVSVCSNGVSSSTVSVAPPSSSSPSSSSSSSSSSFHHTKRRKTNNGITTVNNESCDIVEESDVEENDEGVSNNRALLAALNKATLRFSETKPLETDNKPLNLIHNLRPRKLATLKGKERCNGDDRGCLDNSSTEESRAVCCDSESVRDLPLPPPPPHRKTTVVQRDGWIADLSSSDSEYDESEYLPPSPQSRVKPASTYVFKGLNYRCRGDNKRAEEIPDNEFENHPPPDLPTLPVVSPSLPLSRNTRTGSKPTPPTSSRGKLKQITMDHFL